MSERKRYSRTALLAVAAVLVVAVVLVALDLSGVVRRVEATTTTTTLSVERSTTIKETLLETSVQTVERTLVSTVRATETVVTTVRESVTVTTSTTKAENWILIMPNFPAPHGSAPGIWRLSDQTAGLFLLMYGNYTWLNANMSLRSIRVVGPGVNKTLDSWELKHLLPYDAALHPPSDTLVIVVNTTLPGARVIVGQVYQVIVEYSREDGTIHRALTWTEEGVWTDELWLVCRDRPPWVE